MNLTIEVQMNYFRTTIFSSYSMTDYKEKRFKGITVKIDKVHV